MSRGASSSYVEGVLSVVSPSSSLWSMNRSDFNRNRKSKNGLGVYCKKCGKRRARTDYERNRTATERNIRFEDRHRVVDGAIEKPCTKCGRSEKEGKYYKCRSNRDGLSSR